MCPPYQIVAYAEYTNQRSRVLAFGGGVDADQWHLIELPGMWQARREAVQVHQAREPHVQVAVQGISPHYGGILDALQALWIRCNCTG